MSDWIGKHVVVTTSHRGVFFGTLTKREGSDIELTDARVCIYWTRETRGFVGLAKTGPLGGSRVSPACPRMAISSVTSISECTPESIARWENGPWN